MHDKLSFLGADLLKDTLPSIVNETNDSILKMTQKRHLLLTLVEKMNELMESKRSRYS